jgi:hypothetical protein
VLGLVDVCGVSHGLSGRPDVSSCSQADRLRIMASAIHTGAPTADDVAALCRLYANSTGAAHARWAFVPVALALSAAIIWTRTYQKRREKRPPSVSASEGS